MRWLTIKRGSHLPVSDGELHVESDDKRQNSSDESRLELGQYEGVDERVRAVPEQQDKRSEEEVVESCVHDRELSSRLHLCRRLQTAASVTASESSNQTYIASQ